MLLFCITLNFSYLWPSAEDTFARKNSNKFVFSLTYAYLWPLAEDTFARQKAN